MYKLDQRFVKSLRISGAYAYIEIRSFKQTHSREQTDTQKKEALERKKIHCANQKGYKIKAGIPLPQK